MFFNLIAKEQMTLIDVIPAGLDPSGRQSNARGVCLVNVLVDFGTLKYLTFHTLLLQ